MSITKARINLKEGTIELEGSEAFVKKYLDEFKETIIQFGATEEPEAKGRRPEGRRRRTGKAPKKPVSIAPIPLDLKGEKDRPSLREVFKQKSPKTNEEKLTVFTYYLNKYLGINEVKPGHIVSCCNFVKTRKPKNISSLFVNIKHRKGWVDWSKTPGTVKVTTSGENLVEFDLPRKKNAKPE